MSYHSSLHLLRYRFRSLIFQIIILVLLLVIQAVKVSFSTRGMEDQAVLAKLHDSCFRRDLSRASHDSKSAYYNVYAGIEYNLELKERIDPNLFFYYLSIHF